MQSTLTPLTSTHLHKRDGSLAPFDAEKIRQESQHTGDPCRCNPGSCLRRQRQRHCKAQDCRRQKNCCQERNSDQRDAPEVTLAGGRPHACLRAMASAMIGL